MIPLESLTACFQGLIPSWLCTCSADGVPNAAILSHVDYVDPKHVALSFQFFNKSKRNVMENPKALVRVYDPDTFQVHALRLRYVRTETEGPLFESMRLRIEAIASYSGLKGIFKLLGADVYEVLDVSPIPWEVGLPGASCEEKRKAGTPDVPFTMKALQEFSEGIQRAPTLDRLLDVILETLERHFGFGHSMILLCTERPDRLELIASRGYAQAGVGSEVGFGQGIAGLVAEARKPIRISGMLRQMLYANAVATQVGLCPEDRRIPLPGLAHPASQLGIPLLVRDELIGVLVIESEESYRFHEEDRAYLEVLGGYLAIAVQHALLKERMEDAEELPAPAAESSPGKRHKIEVAYYRGDECILVDGEYLVRSMPAKILWKLLQEHAEQGSTEFTNRRLRLDKSLQFPQFKDNLESRLILLRRRLEERCPEIRIVQAGRGRFRFDLGAEVALVERP
ncbi:MAG TPA: GAF domain-containing protein [Candidatus Polarisedimenticolaceae bacterium]|nr:GAF domain-containing protein [Candidatus Polarisedimenticolaceae bacterium]